MATFPGFDMSNWDPRTVWLWQRSNLRFCIFYLSHGAPAYRTRTPTWLPHWHDLRDSGWHLWPVWVPFDSRVIMADMPKADGSDHGRVAADVAAKSGIERGATLYLDLEAPVIAGSDPARSPFAKYVNDWAIAVRKAGYSAGVYCSYLDATRRGLLDPFFSEQKLVLWPFAIGSLAHPRGKWTQDTFTIGPVPPEAWPVTPGQDWPAPVTVVGCQYDWFGQVGIHWPDAQGKPETRPAFAVDWDAAKTYDPAHPLSSVAVALCPDRAATDWVHVHIVRSGELDYTERDRSGRLAIGVCLNFTASDVGPTPAHELDGFDSASAAAVSRRSGCADLFFLGMDGFVRTIWQNPREKWPKHPWPLNPRDLARKGSPIAAVSRTVDQLDVFFVNRLHQVTTQWWNPGALEWNRNVRTLPGSLVAGGSNLCALPQPTDPQPAPNRLDVFYVGFDYALTPANAANARDWDAHWHVARAQWTQNADWQVAPIDGMDGVAAASGVTAARDGAAALHVLAQDRARTKLKHAILANGAARWDVGSGPGPLRGPRGATPPWWLTFHAISISGGIAVVGLTSLAELAWASYVGGRWSAVGQSAVRFDTGRPLALARRGNAFIDAVGVDGTGDVILRSLAIGQNGALTLTPAP